MLLPRAQEFLQFPYKYSLIGKSIKLSLYDAKPISEKIDVLAVE